MGVIVDRSDGGARRAVLFDYGGVLTRPVASSFAEFESANGIQPGRCFALLLAASQDPTGGPIGALERGEMSPGAFDTMLRTMLTDAGHRPPDAGSLLDGLFAGMVPDGTLWSVAAEARAAGVATGLLSNSWGMGMYPWDRIEAHFDVAVVSGQIGLRKPDPAIFEFALDRVGVAPAACAFVDDLAVNVEVARSLGMVGIHHTGDEDTTVAALGAFLAGDHPG